MGRLGFARLSGLLREGRLLDRRLGGTMLAGIDEANPVLGVGLAIIDSQANAGFFKFLWLERHGWNFGKQSLEVRVTVSPLSAVSDPAAAQ